MTHNTTRNFRKPAPRKQLADGRLDRAIFLDFESFKNGDPLLAGVRIDGHFKQVVLDQRLALAAFDKNLEVVEPTEWALSLVERAIEDDRLVVGFSKTELEGLAELGAELPAHRYVNARKIAKPWRRKFRPVEHKQVARNRRKFAKSKSSRQQSRLHSKEGNRLIDYTVLVGIVPPHMYAHRRVTKRLRSVLQQLDRHGDYSRLTRTAKANWTNVLEHNRFDVEGLAGMLHRMIGDYFSTGV
ncbi:MAG: hypothetical protein VB859_14960 [Planctomycetaceae bacterium]